MILSKKTKHLLKTYNVKPKRALSQNFLIDLALLRQMVEYAEIDVSDTVLDIGAGFGFLTKLLSEKAKQVIAVEFDSKLVKALKIELSERTNITILEGDILKTALPPFNIIVANPPYALSSQLFNTFIKTPFKRVIVTLQREFALKLISKKHSKNYCSLGVIAAYKFDIELKDRVPREAFFPVSPVDSVIVQIEPREPPFYVENQEFYFNLVKFLFTQKRKKLKNALSLFFHEKIDEKNAQKAIFNPSFLDFRINELAPEDLGLISNNLLRFI